MCVKSNYSGVVYVHPALVPRACGCGEYGRVLEGHITYVTVGHLMVTYGDLYVYDYIISVSERATRHPPPPPSEDYSVLLLNTLCFKRHPKSLKFMISQITPYKNVYNNVYICLCRCMCMCMYIYIYICVCVCVYMCSCITIHVCMNAGICGIENIFYIRI